MKNLLVLTLCSILFLSCKKNVDKTNHETLTQKYETNKMVALMDDMMKKMHAGYSGNNDADYAKMMIEHHKGAVEMAKLQLNEGKNPELKKFSEKIMIDQGREIDIMQKHTDKSEKSSNSSDFQTALNASMSAMMGNNTKIYNDIDKDFVAQMIPHHQSAVEMAKAYLKFGKDAQLVQISNDIIKNQNAEILFLQNWLSEN